MAILIFSPDDPMWTIPSGSTTKIYGTNGSDELAIQRGSDVIFDPSFSRGGDKIYIQADSTEFTVSRFSSTVILTDSNGKSIQVPSGSTALSLVFGNGSADLVITGGKVMLGTQTILTNTEPVSASLNTSLTSDTMFNGSADPFSGYTLTSDASIVTEGNTVTYIISSDKAITSDTAFNYTITGSQISPSDFSSATFGTVTMKAGTRQADFTIAISDNDGAESNENFTVAVMDSTGITFVDSIVTTITDSGTPTDPYELASKYSSINARTGDLLDTSDTIVMALDSGTCWPSLNLSYTFNTSIPPEYWTHSDSAQITPNWKPLSPVQESAVEDTFNKLQEITGLVFTKTSSNGDIRFNAIDMVEEWAGFAYYPEGQSPVDGDVFISNINEGEYTQLPGDFGYSVFWHEIGHAIGLKHPFEGDVTLPATIDDSIHTVMSYTDRFVNVASFSYSGTKMESEISMSAIPSGYSLYDVAALQAIYGANTNTRTGNDTYTFNDQYSSHEYTVIWDAGGTDTINASSVDFSCLIDLSPGTFSGIDIHTLDEQRQEAIDMYVSAGFSRGSAENFVDGIYSSPDYTSNLYTGENNLAVGFGVIIENVTTGNGDDTVTDNQVDNIISTGAGNDTIAVSKGGFDRVNGGDGSDILALAVNRNDIVIYPDNGTYIIIGDIFAVELTGVESIRYADGSIYSL